MISYLWRKKERAKAARFLCAFIHKKTRLVGGCFFGLVAGVGFEPADAAGDCLQSPRAERPSAGFCPAFLFYLCRVG